MRTVVKNIAVCFLAVLRFVLPLLILCVCAIFSQVDDSPYSANCTVNIQAACHHVPVK